MISVIQIIQTIEDKMGLKPRVKVKAQGRAVSIPNARVKDGKLEVDGPRKKLQPHVKFAIDKKQKVKRGKRI
jgi:hypothetical protein